MTTLHQIEKEAKGKSLSEAKKREKLNMLIQ
jgi:hypothetical protein